MRIPIQNRHKANTLKHHRYTHKRRKPRWNTLPTNPRPAYDVLKWGRTACRNLKGRASNFICSI